MQLLETIKYEKGIFHNLDFHQHRMNISRKELFDTYDKIDLISILNLQPLPTSNYIYKCRVIYETTIKEVEFIPYQLPHIKSLQLVYCDDIDYRYKFLNRNKINELYSQKGDASDVVIVKNGLITDSSFANLLFYNGESWITPIKPLLQGTQRAKLLKEGRIVEADISPDSLFLCTKVRLVNAMIRFEDEVDVLTENIKL